MKNLRNALFLSVAVLMASPVVHASQDEDAARASIFAPVQAAYEFYQVEARRGQNQVDAIEDELRDPELSAERKQTLRVALAALRADAGRNDASAAARVICSRSGTVRPQWRTMFCASCASDTIDISRLSVWNEQDTPARHSAVIGCAASEG